jgi:hypothetical protein
MSATQPSTSPHDQPCFLAKSPRDFFGVEFFRNPCAKTYSKFFGLLSFQFSKVNKYYSCTVLRFTEQELVSNSGQLISTSAGFSCALLQ